MNKPLILSKICMRCLLTVLLALFMTAGVHAQLVTITAEGIIASFEGVDPSVDGTNYTETFTFNLNAPVFASGSGFTQYYDSQGTGTISFGAYTLTASDVYVTVDLNRNGTTTGFNFASDATGSGFTAGSGYALSLYSSNASLISSTALSSVTPIDLGNFNTLASGFASGTTGGGSASIDGTVTSFDVMIETPEPSTYAMLIVGLGMLAFWRLRIRRVATRI